MLSVVIPAFNEQENIPAAAEKLSEILSPVTDFELIFVDDGSRDNTWNIIKELSEKDKSVKGLHFSRNFGKEGAIFAGLKAASGDCVAVIDCDLQHPPQLLPDMLSAWKNGAEVVEAVKSSRGKEGIIYKLFAKSFYRMMKNSSNINLDGASDYKLMDRKVVDALNDMPERLTFFRALSCWVGFKTERIEFDVAPRNAGKTKWSFRKLFKYALSSITSFTNVPMQIITVSGILFFIFAIILGVQTIVNFCMGTAADGFSTVILLILIVGSILMLGIGIIGYYLSKIYEEIKCRPRYIVSERAGDLSGQDNKR
ncbi:MAG: glycosyltransferase family 2 protein [Ruminococcaceae bacterium]|nr:glycosyltransferase family 2 protein [Oscillospiraceae bacterium]